MSKEKITAPRSWDDSEKTFKGRSDKTYKILDSLTLGRYRMLPVLELKLTFGCDSDTIIQFVNLFWSHFDGKVEMSVVAQHAVNLSRSYKDMQLRKDAIIRICALWTSSEGEDLSSLSEEVIDAKVEDWLDIDINFFFRVATSKVASYMKNWRQISQMISQLEKMGQLEPDS